MQDEKLTKARSYLKKYGYIDSPERVARAMSELERSREPFPVDNADNKMSFAIKRFQDFAGLPVTGKLNNPTIEQMEKPRCGFPDVTTKELRSFSLNALKWSSFNLSYGFQNFTNQIPTDQIREAIQMAFDIWTLAVPFQFHQVPIDNNPKIVIRFARDSHGDNFPFDGVEGTLAHAFPPNSSLGGLAGDIHFDDDEIWSVTSPTSDKDLVSVAAHEIGHSLGLGHSSVRESLMYAIYEGEHRFLHDEDIANITDLYGV